MAIEPTWLDDVEQLLTDQGLANATQLSLLEAWRQGVNARIPEDDNLWCSCRNARECWGSDEALRPDHMRVRLPWIGPHFAARRVAVVAINSRDDGRPDAEIRATLDVIASLKRNHRGYGPSRRSYFHYRVAAAVYAAMQSQDGRPIDDHPAAVETARSLEYAARLQAVQCSPCTSPRRTPTSAMVRNCPGFLLREQLELLAPNVLMLFGQPAHRAIEESAMEMAWATTWKESGNCFSHGQTLLAGRPLTVCAFVHPSTAAWSRSWTKFRESLTENPLRSAANG